MEKEITANPVAQVNGVSHISEETKESQNVAGNNEEEEEEEEEEEDEEEDDDENSELTTFRLAKLSSYMAL